MLSILRRLWSGIFERDYPDMPRNDVTIPYLRIGWAGRLYAVGDGQC